MTIETRVHLPCLLLPVFTGMLLLPASAIAETIAYQKSEVEMLPDVPTWFVGMLTWRGIQVPLVFLEQMEPYASWNGIAQSSEPNKQPYIAVVNRITKINSNIEAQKFRQYPFFAMVLEGTPKWIRVSNQSLSMNDKKRASDPCIIMEVKIAENIAGIPNLENMWKIIDTLPSRLQWLGKIGRKRGDLK